MILLISRNRHSLKRNHKRNHDDKNNPSFPLNLYLAKIRPAGALTIIPKAIVAAQIIRVFISDFPKVRMVKILMYASRVKISGIKELIDKDIVEAEISAFGLSDAPITQNIGSNINARKAPKTIQNKTLDPIFMTLSFLSS